MPSKPIMENIRMKLEKETTFETSRINNIRNQIIHSIEYTFTVKCAYHKVEGEVLKMFGRGFSLRLSLSV
jgi:hypothetical protein